jgi:hypothetical protein
VAGDEKALDNDLRHCQAVNLLRNLPNMCCDLSLVRAWYSEKFKANDVHQLLHSRTSQCLHVSDLLSVDSNRLTL